MTPDRPARLAWPSVALAALGILLCVSLVDAHLAARAGGVSESLFCGALDSRGCDDVALHPWSTVAGFPLPVWGLLFYVFVLAVLVAGLALDGPERAAAWRVGAGVCGAAVLLDVALGAVMVLDVGSVCVDCVATYALNVALLLAFIRLARHGPPGSASVLLPRWRALRSHDDRIYYRALFKASLMIAVMGTGAVVLTLVAGPLEEIEHFGREQIEALLERIEHEPAAFDPERLADQPALGPEDAALQLTLAGDFACNLCRSIARTAERLRREHPDAIRLVFVNAPLCTDCNPAVGVNIHPEACRLAELGEAAHAQGRFWDFHELVFDRLGAGGVDEDEVLEALEHLRLDRRAFDAALDDGRAREAVAADVALCAELGFTTTPSLAFNGHVKRGSMFPWMLEEIVTTMLGGAP